MKCRSLVGPIFLLAALGLISIVGLPTAAASGNLAGTKICIDPGHGGSDPGAVNEAFSLRESEINLDVSYGLKHLLELQGAEVVMTRTGDDYRTNSDRYTLCNSVQATILVSVHTNSVTDPLWDGSLGLYGPSAGPALAQVIYDVMYPALRDTAPSGVEVFRDFGVDRFASGVLFKSDMPAAMMEPLFMSNPAEAELLVTRIFDDASTGAFSQDCGDFTCRRGEIAQALYAGVLDYFAPAESMHVAHISMAYEQKGPKFFVYSYVTVADSSGSPVSGAAVSVNTTGPNGLSVSSAESTGPDGIAAFRLRTDQAGSYVSTVTDVVKQGWEYDETANVETTETLQVPLPPP